MFFFNGIVDGMVEHVWIAFHIARDYTSMIELTEEGSVGVALRFHHLSYLGAGRCGKYPSGSHGSSLVQQQRRSRQWTALGDRSASCSMICPRQATTPPRPDMLGARWCRRQRTGGRSFSRGSWLEIDDDTSIDAAVRVPRTSSSSRN